MTQLPLVTLAMPVYNVSKFVEKSLLSALNQTYRNIEFLIVDDCSTDNSMDIVRQTVNAHKRSADVRIIHHPGNQGLGDTRNTAIKEAKGEYIYFMDSDDIISSCCIEVLVNYMLENPVDFIAASRERRTFNGKLISTDQYQPYTDKDDHRSTLPVAYFRYVENHKILAEVWNKLYNVDFLRKNKIRCIPHVHVEDVSFSLQVNIAAKSCRLVPDVLYVYHIYEGQSFAAFNNNHERALYLADCFVKIRKYDADIVYRGADWRADRATFRQLKDAPFPRKGERSSQLLRLHVDVFQATCEPFRYGAILGRIGTALCGSRCKTRSAIERCAIAESRRRQSARTHDSHAQQTRSYPRIAHLRISPLPRIGDVLRIQSRL